MRSRYTASAVGDADYLFRSWHPRTRPQDVTLEPDVVWTGLQIVASTGGQPDDDTGTVEFIASYVQDGVSGSLHENSQFAKRARRWLYLTAL